MCLNLCFVAQVENVICHVVDYVACRSISANHKRQFSVRGFRPTNSQLFGTFPYDLRKMPSSFLPSTTTEIIVFVFAIPATRGNQVKRRASLKYSMRSKRFQSSYCAKLRRLTEIISETLFIQVIVFISTSFRHL